MGKRKIAGTIVCRCRDEYGEIIVADDRGHRSLYFGDGVLQSCIRIDQPDALLMDYSQAMIGALLFRDHPESVLLIGLGGCSLVNFFLKALPACSVDVVEIRQQVIDLARDLFLLPGPHATLKIFPVAGQDFITQRGDECRDYDLILVDAFDEGGPAATLLEKDFLASCRDRLTDNGIFAMNVWNRPEDRFPSMYARVREVFGDKTLKLLLGEAYRNAIVFGFNNAAMLQDLTALRPVAKKLRRYYHINFPRYLKSLYMQNAG